MSDNTLINSSVDNILVILDQSPTILINTEPATVLESIVENNLIISIGPTAVVETEAISLLVEQVEITELLEVGIQGPPGISEEDIVYSKRTDFINDLLLYRGEAIVGSLNTAPVWRIRQIILTDEGDATEVWASGTALFDKQWSERLTYNYI